ncbi:hypothetical protein [Kitasatospora sp. NBC_01300]|uniref:hypothetical protein n=1 Tax=Kitasatospora sp. NBC_01300 TaxID=2903574 RepID=UPI002F91553D|nr:hypothetical protein OG556_40370 [Kitasatospora sp. NBC_01300]
MRLRLQAAVHALLADESVAGLPDAARLAAVVVFAKGAVETGRTVLWSGELAKWLGVSVSMVSHKVLPPLRARGAMRTLVVTNEAGEPVALDLSLEPVARLRRARDVRHPLALSLPDLVTLMRLCEALFGPGRTPKDAAPTPPGLLAQRVREQRHGAATDRLALLLLVLACRENGWLKLCSGSLKAPELGRGAATLGLLMRGGAKAVTPAAADRLLCRLEGNGMAQVERDENGVPTGRVTLLPVAESYAAARPAKKVPTARPAARPRLREVEVPQAAAPAAGPACPDAEAVQEAPAGSSLPSVSTEGDLGSPEAPPEAPASSGPAEMPVEAAGSPVSASAEFHAPHAPVVTPSGSADEVDGSSGACAVGASHRRPERADAREDRQESGLPNLRLVGAADDPLCGEQPNTQLDQNTDRQQVAAPDQPVPYVGLPSDGYLARAISPAEELWVRLTNPSTRDFVLKHVRAALEGITVWTGADAAPEALAARLAFRLKRQRTQGNPTVTDPVGWFLKRGLPQERLCSHPACDNGIRTGSDADCNCELRVQDRRATRRAVIRQVVQQMPGADFEQRQAPIEQALAEHAAHRAAVQVETERRAREEAARWETQRPEREALAAEAERVRLAVPCADCGAGQAGGLCRSCARTREMAEVERECLVVALAFLADLADLADERPVRQVREHLVEHLASSREFARRGAVDDLIDGAGQIAELSAVKLLLADYRQLALEHFAGSERARAEADAAHGAVMRAAHRYPSKAAAREQAQADAEQARGRAARWLLEQQLAVVADWLARTEPQPAAPAVGEAGRGAVGADLVRAAVNERLAAELDRELRATVRECIDVAVAARAELSVYASVREVWEQTRQEVRRVRDEARAGAAEGVRGQAELSAVRRMIAEYREEALEWLMDSDRAQCAAETAFEAELRLRAYQGERAARAGALRAADAACLRVAEQDLARLVAEVQRRRERAGGSTARKAG